MVYERLGYDDVHETPAVLLGDIARAVIPMEHTTQPGIRYNWQADVSGRTVVSRDLYLDFLVDCGLGILSEPRRLDRARHRV
ncbi:MAG: hypothetical protein K6T75_04730 [Acetobacteraceae bacterium]|nr:hypothetical protein [Acetobacteraceae bacterium]